MPLGIAQLLCTVVGIADGDTLTARCGIGIEATTLQVRLAEVDAPEKGLAFGSRQHLAALCFQQRPHVRPIAANGGVWPRRINCDH
jgi:endonuclease YncB( thermonuclease family)